MIYQSNICTMICRLPILFEQWGVRNCDPWKKAKMANAMCLSMMFMFKTCILKCFNRRNTALTVRKVRTLLLSVSPKSSSCFTQEFLVCGLLRKRHLCWKKSPGNKSHQSKGLFHCKVVKRLEDSFLPWKVSSIDCQCYESWNSPGAKMFLNDSDFQIWWIFIVQHVFEMGFFVLQKKPVESWLLWNLVGRCICSLAPRGANWTPKGWWIVTLQAEPCKAPKMRGTGNFLMT